MGQLAHAVTEGHVTEAIDPFLMVFFAIWWAWNQFAWIASAWDNDDALYRVLTLVQMGGVLVLAAGVPAAFDRQDFAAITLVAVALIMLAPLAGPALGVTVATVAITLVTVALLVFALFTMRERHRDIAIAT